MSICSKQHLEAKFIKELSNTEAGLKKSVAYKKKRVLQFLPRDCVCKNIFLQKLRNSFI